MRLQRQPGQERQESKRPGERAGGGDVGRGDEVTREAAPGGAPTIAELFDLWYEVTPSRKTLERYLGYPLAVRLRQEIEERLAKG